MSLYTLFYVNENISTKNINDFGKEFHLSFLELDGGFTEFGLMKCFRVFWSGCDRGSFVFGKRRAPELDPRVKAVLEEFFPDEPSEYDETMIREYLQKEETCELDRVGFLRAFFEAEPTATVGILQHWVSGSFENEPIEVSAVEFITLQTKPEQLENDVLYVMESMVKGTTEQVPVRSTTN